MKKLIRIISCNTVEELELQLNKIVKEDYVLIGHTFRFKNTINHAVMKRPLVQQPQIKGV